MRDKKQGTNSKHQLVSQLLFLGSKAGGRGRAVQARESSQAVKEIYVVSWLVPKIILWSSKIFCNSYSLLNTYSQFCNASFENVNLFQCDEYIREQF